MNTPPGEMPICMPVAAGSLGLMEATSKPPGKPEVCAKAMETANAIRVRGGSILSVLLSITGRAGDCYRNSLEKSIVGVMDNESGTRSPSQDRRDCAAHVQNSS